jgi:hypothetical protein
MEYSRIFHYFPSPKKKKKTVFKKKKNQFLKFSIISENNVKAAKVVGSLEKWFAEGRNWLLASL